MGKRICNIAGMKKYVEILYLLNPANETKLLCNETIFYNWAEEQKICCDSCFEEESEETVSGEWITMECNGGTNIFRKN